MYSPRNAHAYKQIGTSVQPPEEHAIQTLVVALILAQSQSSTIRSNCVIIGFSLLQCVQIVLIVLISEAPKGFS